MLNLVVGAGYAGAVCARLLAEQGEKVIIIDRRSHIGGNMYEEIDPSGVRIHKYGPHISVMKDERIFNFLSRFTEWVPYEHRVNALIDGHEVPLPINFNSLITLFGDKMAYRLIELLLSEFGANKNVPILELRKSDNAEIRELAEFVYEKVFLHYTVKMWGLAPTELDPAVTGRVPVRLSFDDRHFLHTFQVMPKSGFNALFENMLNHDNIKVRLNTAASDVLKADADRGVIYFEGKEFDGRVIYTGALDELFGYCCGELPYRTLRFEFETHKADEIQATPVQNWPDSRPATRRTEMKKLTGQKIDGVTSTITEYPGAYIRGDEIWGEPLYPIANEKCAQQYNEYLRLAEKIPNLYTTGRLANYRYYNMEDTIKEAMKTVDGILQTNNSKQH